MGDLWALKGLIDEGMHFFYHFEFFVLFYFLWSKSYGSYFLSSFIHFFYSKFNY